MGLLSYAKGYLGQDVPTGTYLANAKSHLGVINRHKLEVMRNCFAVGLYRQGLCHDLSKYSPEEFLAGMKHFQGTRSPNAAEREESGHSRAWMHHKGRNKHHYEYWIDQVANRDARFEGKPMPTRYVVEMFCDRVAACKVYNGDAYTDQDALNYFYMEQGSGDLLIHPDTKAFLGWMLMLLAEEGEEYAFAYVRERVVKPRFVYGEGGTFE